ncbi:MAG: molybdate ABC transporter substrate-binding protein [Pseudomonadales bacterium]|jgi:molybdate transport system substrate-binding protein|nr:molybdate ABC transporter substrate-binding protein [Pseudomonadales bacterium]
MRRLVLVLMLLVVTPARADVTVFAAASLADVLGELTAAWSARGGDPVRLSLAASSTLARQIEQGAPADLYLSANLAWMDRLEQAGLLDPASRRVLARGRLVLVAPADSALRAGDVAALLQALPAGARVAIGDPAHVPAGVYAAAALETLGLGGIVARRSAHAADVRSALALVARGEAPLGIVYETDAALTDRVRIVGAFPANSHPPIVYPAARLADAREPRAADALLGWLASAEARAIWRRHGFADPSGS